MAWRAALIDKIKLLTPSDIRDAMARHIVPGNMSVVVAGDFGKTVE
jgi:predicted Zn-dependent peptidase